MMSLSTSRNYNKFDVYVFLLIATNAFGAIGNALTMSRLVAILLFPLFIGLLKRKELSSYMKPFISGTAFLLVYSILSLAWSNSIGNGVVECIYNFVHLIYFLEIIVFSMKSNRPIDTIAIAWMVAFLLTSALAMYELTTDYHLPISRFDEDLTMNAGGIRIYRKFASATFTNFNTYVTFICVCLPFVIYCLCENKILFMRWVLPILALVLSIIILIIDASRGGIISLVIMLGVLLLKSKHSKTSLFIIFLLAVVLIYIFQSYQDILFVSITARMKDGSDSMVDGSNRYDIWLNAIRVFKNYFGLGCGAGALEKATEAVTSNWVLIPHNFFLELLASYGLFPFLVVVCFVLKRFVMAIKRSYDRSRKIALFCIFFAMPIYMIINSGYLQWTLVYALFACIVVYTDSRTFVKN